MKPNKYAFALIALVVVLSGCNGIVPAATGPQAQTSSPVTTPAPTAVPSDRTSTATPETTTGSAADATEVPVPSENPLAPEKNPPGDIPDSQVFVKYTNTVGGYSFEAPEGWARTENGTDVKFADKFDGVQASVAQSADPFSVDNIKAVQVADLQKNGRAVTIKDVSLKNTKGGQAIVVTYESNSEPDAVTGKQVRLEDQCYYYFKDGKLAALSLWAPLGADNVDQWKYMSDSFRWN